jgi:ankyrin repeat protein
LTIALKEETKQLKLLEVLSEVASNGCVDDVKMLIAKGANLKFKVSTQGIKARSPLLYAIRANYLPVVEVLLKHGADPNVFDEDTGLPCLALAWTLHRDNTSMFDTLLRFGASPRATFVSSLRPTARWTIVHEMVSAASTILIDFEDWLLANKDDITFSMGGGPTPLQAACLCRKSDVNLIRIEIVNILIEHGANVSAPFGEYTEVIPALCKEGALDLVEILLEHGADPNAHIKNSKCSVLHLACEAVN